MKGIILFFLIAFELLNVCWGQDGNWGKKVPCYTLHQQVICPGCQQRGGLFCPRFFNPEKESPKEPTITPSYTNTITKDVPEFKDTTKPSETTRDSLRTTFGTTNERNGTRTYSPYISSEESMENQRSEDISSRESIENQPSDISPEDSMENQRSDISSGESIENHPPDISPEDLMENQRSDISSRESIENHSSDISLEESMENQHSDISSRESMENQRSAKDSIENKRSSKKMREIEFYLYKLLDAFRKRQQPPRYKREAPIRCKWNGDCPCPLICCKNGDNQPMVCKKGIKLGAPYGTG